MLHPITHTAVVDSVSSTGDALVHITDVGAEDCTGCRIATMCRRDERVAVAVHVSDGLCVRAGQRVEISAPGTVSRRAVALLLLLPVAVLVAAVAITVLAGGSEGASVAVGLVALCVTFILLYMLRSRVEASAKWSIIRIIE